MRARTVAWMRVDVGAAIRRTRCLGRDRGPARILSLLITLVVAMSCRASLGQCAQLIPTAADAFGTAVDMGSDYLVVGAQNDDTVAVGAGTAFIYRFDGVLWTLDQQIFPSIMRSSVAFGQHVAVDGATVAVTGRSDAFVFGRDRRGWYEQSQLFPSGRVTALGVLGWTIDVSGDAVILGTPRAFDEFGQSGAAYVFRFDGTRWTQEQELTLPTPEQNGFLGWSVAIDGDVAAVGAIGRAIDGCTSCGEVYMYEFDGRAWVETQVLSASEETVFFGDSVAIDDTRLLVGAARDAFDNNGAIFVFDRMGETWVETAKLLSPDRSLNDFGAWLDVRGETIAAGSGSFEGAMNGFVFRNGGRGWEQIERFFGRYVRIDPDDENTVAAGGAMGGVRIYRLADGSDCNDNGICDDVDIAEGASDDADGDGIPDECRNDCNGNGVFDFIDIEQGTSPDVNDNGLPDECEDCNENGVFDLEDVLNGTSEDCNGNKLPDECDVASGRSRDANGDGIPDECLGVENVTQGRLYATIQAAIDAANDGDEIVASPLTFPETIDLLGKAITLRSLAGPERTIIDGDGLEGSVVTCVNGEGRDTVIEGFTITRGSGHRTGDDTLGGGMRLDGADITVRNCWFVDNDLVAEEESESLTGGAAHIRGGAPVFENCDFRSNAVVPGFIRYNFLSHGGAIYVSTGADVSFTDCTFVSNVATTFDTGSGGGDLREAEHVRNAHALRFLEQPLRRLLLPELQRLGWCGDSAQRRRGRLHVHREPLVILGRRALLLGGNRHPLHVRRQLCAVRRCAARERHRRRDGVHVHRQPRDLRRRRDLQQRRADGL